MPILTNSRHERFAQSLAQGKTIDEAYVLAGFKENSSNASRLNGNERIQRRIEEILSVAAEKASVTVESLIAEAEEVRAAAVEDGQYAAAVAAIKEKGVLSGMRVERAERGKPGEFDGLTIEQKRERAFNLARELGFDNIGPTAGTA